jgi:flavin reductase (DIM6/NTAB) family NADH-FMN oxidoreductase RutF
MDKMTWKPGTMLYPLPAVMVTCGTIESPNVMTAAWTGIVCSEPPMTYVSIRRERYSYEIIKESGEYVINLTTEKLARIADYCGVKSGRDEQKFEKTAITAVPAVKINAPLIDESPVNIECRLEKILPLGSHDMFLAKIVAVNVRKNLIDKTGALHLERAGLVSYNHGKYYTLGRELGGFGFSVKKR